MEGEWKRGSGKEDKPVYLDFSKDKIQQLQEFAEFWKKFGQAPMDEWLATL